MALVSSTISPKEARRGEIWVVNFDPTVGSEIKKSRPAIVLSLDGLSELNIRLVVPVTGWKAWHEGSAWCVTIAPSVKNGLHKKCVADVLQTKCVSTDRFIEKIGSVSAEMTEEVAAALAAVTGYA